MRKLFGLAMVLGIAAASMAQNALKIGDPAPPVVTTKWVKGEPLKAFEPGKLYVVEFWATWCGPCKASIPHLTELAHKYAGKVSFNGISIWEESNPAADETAYQARVDKFVQDWGGKMDYNVGAGGTKAVMSDSWMRAAGRNGIPSAFIVQDGKIVWAGHPMVGLDETLGQILAGTYDVNALAAKMNPEIEANLAMTKVMKPINAAMRAKDYALALTEIDKAIAANAKLETQLGITKFNVLLRTDEASAYPYARQLAEGVYKDNSNVLNSIAWSMVDDHSTAKNPDYKTAVDIAAKAVALTKDDDAKAMVLDTYAYALYKSGDIDGAIKASTEAVALVNKPESKFDAATKKELTDRLDFMKKKKAGGK